MSQILIINRYSIIITFNDISYIFKIVWITERELQQVPIFRKKVNKNLSKNRDTGTKS